MLREIKTATDHYFLDENDDLQGEYKEWWSYNRLYLHCFHVDSVLHGEYKQWRRTGLLIAHCFYIKGKKFSFEEMPYPETDEDRMYFKLKYDLPLLPTETIC